MSFDSVRVSSSASSRAASVGRPEAFYPSPFFDIARTYLPSSIKDTFDWCAFYQLTNPLISTVTTKLATYAITDLVYEDESGEVTTIWKDLFEETLKIRTFLLEVNLDRYTFGNAFASIAFPFEKMLECKNCKTLHSASKIGYKWRGLNFHIACPKCSHTGPARAFDQPVKSSKKIRLIRWNPKNITIKYNEITGAYKYYYTMPQSIRSDIVIGRPETLESTPQAFIDSIREKKAILLDPDKIHHARRPAISRSPADSGWGAPLALPVLKDIYFLQILKKSQEAIAMEYITPMRVLFPQVTTDGNNPYAHISLTDWQNEVESQVRKWKQDNNHMPVMPLPIGYQVIGGQGKSMLLHQELRVYGEQIIAGMGVPVSFIYGDGHFSGASVNMRALENEFLGNREDQLSLVRFIRNRIAAFLDYPNIDIRFKAFKMADDIQRTSMNMQLVGNKLLSAHTFMQSHNLDYEDEQELIDKEDNVNSRRNAGLQKKQAEAAGEAGLITTKFQIKSQEMMQESGLGQPQLAPGEDPGTTPPGQAGPPTSPGAVQGVEQSPITATNSGSMVDMLQQARSLASQLKKMDEVDRYRLLAQMRASNPDLYALVNNMQGDQPPAANSIPASLPEQRAPRAGPARAQI